MLPVRAREKIIQFERGNVFRAPIYMLFSILFPYGVLEFVMTDQYVSRALAERAMIRFSYLMNLLEEKLSMPPGTCDVNSILSRF